MPPCDNVHQNTARTPDPSVCELPETQESVTTDERRQKQNTFHLPDKMAPHKSKHEDDGRAGALVVHVASPSHSYLTTYWSSRLSPPHRSTQASPWVQASNIAKWWQVPKIVVASSQPRNAYTGCLAEVGPFWLPKRTQSCLTPRASEIRPLGILSALFPRQEIEFYGPGDFLGLRGRCDVHGHAHIHRELLSCLRDHVRATATFQPGATRAATSGSTVGFRSLHQPMALQSESNDTLLLQQDVRQTKTGDVCE